MREDIKARLREGTFGSDIAKTDSYINTLMHGAADYIEALEAALKRIERLAGLVAHDLVGRVEGGKVAAVQQCSDIARNARHSDQEAAE